MNVEPVLVRFWRDRDHHRREQLYAQNQPLYLYCNTFCIQKVQNSNSGEILSVNLVFYLVTSSCMSVQGMKWRYCI
ncbi:hypothetical protein F0562_033951 [Nyssa sinensis]|uniref:Uncharacterized protein n=1 Tax=Nyssa sinensis TaxID=561372 RepID=A0A5J5AF79_9ASTE|nr:hypothetical protein F0562_033951 [Nyssa sinensis]